jgi:hypothetical protein
VLQPLSGAVADMGREADHNLYIVFLCGSGSCFGSGRAKISGLWRKGGFLIVFD